MQKNKCSFILLKVLEKFTAVVSCSRIFFLFFSKERFSAVPFSYIDTKLDGSPSGKREANNRQPIMWKWTVMGNMQIILILKRWWVKSKQVSRDSYVLYCQIYCNVSTESQLLGNVVGLTRKPSALSSVLCLLLKFCIFPVWQLLIVSTSVTDFLHASYSSGGCSERSCLM